MKFLRLIAYGIMVLLMAACGPANKNSSGSNEGTKKELTELPEPLSALMDLSSRKESLVKAILILSDLSSEEEGADSASEEVQAHMDQLEDCEFTISPNIQDYLSLTVSGYCPLSGTLLVKPQTTLSSSARINLLQHIVVHDSQLAKSLGFSKFYMLGDMLFEQRELESDQIQLDFSSDNLRLEIDRPQGRLEADFEYKASSLVDIAEAKDSTQAEGKFTINGIEYLVSFESDSSLKDGGRLTINDKEVFLDTPLFQLFY